MPPVALASSQTQPHFVQLVRSLYFKLNAKSQTQPHFVQLGLFRSYGLCLQHGPVALASSQTQPHFIWLGPCISNSMLSPRPNLTTFG
ncbi:hypothetical protein E4T56_gene11362 [Termitomyces sp. T112]|nr:hypothetical protein E4T56_gene11362 [Termitomyces sp. T112]